MGKIALTNNLAALCHLVSVALGPRLIADTGEDGTYLWAEFILGQPGLRLGGEPTRSRRTSSPNGCSGFHRATAHRARPRLGKDKQVSTDYTKSVVRANVPNNDTNGDNDRDTNDRHQRQRQQRQRHQQQGHQRRLGHRGS